MAASVREAPIVSVENLTSLGILAGANFVRGCAMLHGLHGWDKPAGEQGQRHKWHRAIKPQVWLS